VFNIEIVLLRNCPGILNVVVVLYSSDANSWFEIYVILLQ